MSKCYQTLNCRKTNHTVTFISFEGTNLTGRLFSVCNIEMVILILPVAVNNFLEYHGFA